MAFRYTELFYVFLKSLCFYPMEIGVLQLMEEIIWKRNETVVLSIFFRIVFANNKSFFFIGDVQVCFYLNSQYSLVLSLCSSKHKFCEARSMAFMSSWLLRYRTFYIKMQTTRWSTAEQVRTIQKDSGRYKGGGAELLEEKNQLLQAILDCTSKNVYTIITVYHKSSFSDLIKAFS
jgi:hypothetical protein